MIRLNPPDWRETAPSSAIENQHPYKSTSAMAARSNLVNLDAMIIREDFALADDDISLFEKVQTISLRDFTQGGLMGPNLRKPDFQRETNHWTPEQVASLLQCYINGDLIPSVILWQSPTNVFVIDGGHRLSALKAWILDDYGDGPTSQTFFGYEISDTQIRNAKRTRAIVDQKIGKWTHFVAKSEDQKTPLSEKKLVTAAITRGLPIQWVSGDAEKAESSFFKINTKGTPLDPVEELLLTNRHKPLAISARAIIRAGKGHKYWSSFAPETAAKIEELASGIHTLLFDPELKNPIKTLDLPLGGSKGVREAVQTLIDISLIANRDGQGNPRRLSDTEDDHTGTPTSLCLSKTLSLIQRMTSNSPGSLGLHPAVYFYGPTGRHSSAMFMGTAHLLARKIINNDQNFFPKFTMVRSRLEKVLIDKKDLVATVLQRHISARRIGIYSNLLSDLINRLSDNEIVSDEEIISISGLEGKLIVGTTGPTSTEFSDDTKSKAFLDKALVGALKCPICEGFLDASKSSTYDHIQEKKNGGLGGAKNCQMAHPYCNSGFKNSHAQYIA